MGRGNVCVTGEYEGLYYIDNDYLHVYYQEDENGDYGFALRSELSMEEYESGNWKYDEHESEFNFVMAMRKIKDEMMKRFSSFTECDKWPHHEGNAILENKLFYITVQDNQWSQAVKLIQKEDPYGSLAGLQAKHYPNYLNGLRDILLGMYDTVGIYTGPWTHGTIRREDFA